MALTLVSLSAASPFASCLRASNASSVRCSLTASKAFVSCPSSHFSAQFSLVSSFSGLSVGGLSFSPYKQTSRNRPLTIVAGKKYQLGQTKRSRSRKSLARVHGFRVRSRTPGGRKVLRRRRKKGRKVLCTKTHASSGKKHFGYGRRKRNMRRI